MTHHQKDAFGTLWRTDQLPQAVVDPCTKEPTFHGYSFSSSDAFPDLDVKAVTKKWVAESSDFFTIVSPSFCLWQSWYVRGFETP
jgi:hypothetical protein